LKNIEWQDDRDIYGRMLLLTDSYLFTGLRNAVDNYDADLTDALTWGQLKSKRWLVSELGKLDKDLGIVFLCAGWYAVLASIMFESNLRFDKIRSFDIDKSCANIADTINRKYVVNGWKFKATTLNINIMTYPMTYTTYRKDGSSVDLTEMPNTIINTSCEHIDNFRLWYDYLPPNVLLCLQTNDYFEIEDHINCSKSLDHFAETTPMSNVLFEGELPLEKYNRFMRIGIK
jgi:hypothetical protein